MKDWRFWLGALVSAAFIAFALSRIPDWHRFGQSLLSVRLIYFIPILGTYVMILVLRGFRWQYLLLPTGKARFSSVMSGIIICYFGNNVLPLRAGDVLRAVVVGKRDGQSISAVLATVVVERLFDSLTMLIFLALVLINLDFPDAHANLERALHQGGIAAIFLAAALIVFLYLLYYWTAPMMSVIKKVFKILPQKLSMKLEAVIENFAGGLKILGSPFSLFVVFMLSILVWVVNLGPVFFVGMSMGVKISFTGCLLLLMLGAFSTTIPAAPGYWGTFHVITASGLNFLGLLPEEEALTFAIVLHSIYFFPVVIMGIFVAWREGYSLSKLRQDAASGT